MKYWRKIFVWAVFIALIGIFILPKIDTNSRNMDLYNENCYLEIYKNRIILYNDKKEKIDTYTLKEKIKAYSIGDIDGNGLDELVVLTKDSFKKYGKDVVAFSLEGDIKEICREDFSRLNPWKIALGDIDGDGKKEVSVGVYKKAPFHQVLAKRPFIYSYENHRLNPKWRGSRLSRPFTDYNFCDIDGDGIDEIISIEILENEEKVINTYKWEGFGFTGFLESESYKDIKNLTIKEGRIYFDIKDKGGIYTGQLKFKDNNLKIERVE